MTDAYSIQSKPYSLEKEVVLVKSKMAGETQHVKTLSVSPTGKLFSNQNADQESEKQTEFPSVMYNRSICCALCTEESQHLPRKKTNLKGGEVAKLSANLREWPMWQKQWHKST